MTTYYIGAFWEEVTGNDIPLVYGTAPAVAQYLQSLPDRDDGYYYHQNAEKFCADNMPEDFDFMDLEGV